MKTHAVVCSFFVSVWIGSRSLLVSDSLCWQSLSVMPSLMSSYVWCSCLQTNTVTWLGFSSYRFCPIQCSLFTGFSLAFTTLMILPVWAGLTWRAWFSKQSTTNKQTHNSVHHVLRRRQKLFWVLNQTQTSVFCYTPNKYVRQLHTLETSRYSKFFRLLEWKYLISKEHQCLS